MPRNDNLEIKGAELVWREPVAARGERTGAVPVASVAPRLDRATRLRIVEQALLLLEQSYIHLPQKRAMYAVDPLQRLRLLRYRLEQSRDDELAEEPLFHSEMIEIFNLVRDGHTNYILPDPMKANIAYLPFLVEEYREDNRSHFIVTRLDPTVDHDPAFQEGVEIHYWNGIPIKRAVELNGARLAGGNPEARYQRGLSALTIRPLARMLPPDEEWVRLRYLTLEGTEVETEYRWLVFTVPPESSAAEQAQGSGEAMAFGYDLQWAQTQEIRRSIAVPQLTAPESLSPEERFAYQPADKNPPSIATSLPELFRVRVQPTEAGTFGYARIFSFMHAEADIFVNEFRRLLTLLPQNGLIIDVRNNGGGNIWASERLLNALAPHGIEPARFQFINSPLTLALARRYTDLQVWAPAIAHSVATGAIFSLSFPLTEPAALAGVPRAYNGPIVLITDALCYSATDIFVAGFQDHKVGRILGTAATTGAGGANVWTHSDLCKLVAKLPTDHPLRAGFQPLPEGIEMRVAIRRSLRVGENAGIPVEDLGVVPDEVHNLTRRDLLESNVDLLEMAGLMLREMMQKQ